MGDGISISTITDAKMAAWANICDVNKDGVLKGNEVSVFNEAKANMFDNGSGTTIGGVDIIYDNVVGVMKNDKGKVFDYTVKFDNGAMVYYDRQSESNEGTIRCIPINNESFSGYYIDVDNITDGDGVAFLGSRGNDELFIDNSKIYELDGLRGQDLIWAYGSVGHPASGKIFAEKYNITNSPNITATEKSGTVLQGKKIQRTTEAKSYASNY